jgi:hypothetical protein
VNGREYFEYGRFHGHKAVAPQWVEPTKSDRKEEAPKTITATASAPTSPKQAPTKPTLRKTSSQPAELLQEQRREEPMELEGSSAGNGKISYSQAAQVKKSLQPIKAPQRNIQQSQRPNTANGRHPAPAPKIAEQQKYVEDDKVPDLRNIQQSQRPNPANGPHLAPAPKIAEPQKHVEDAKVPDLSNFPRITITVSREQRTVTVTNRQAETAIARSFGKAAVQHHDWAKTATIAKRPPATAHQQQQRTANNIRPQPRFPRRPPSQRRMWEEREANRILLELGEWGDDFHGFE